MIEKQNIECKQSWHDDHLKWVCGFANAIGGKIYIGKDDDGNIMGIDNVKILGSMSICVEISRDYRKRTG